MRTQVIEVDEDVFQITTEHSDGSVTVDLFVGYDAYAKHMQTETQDGIERGHLPEASNSLSLRH